jgi:tungstate transport system substrate-binding protein
MRPRRLFIALAAVAVLAAPASTASAATSTVVVQGGTTISDSGLLQNVILPGFKKAFPQYTLQFVPVGTGQALTNAELGLGDAVFTHNPTAEAQFVQATTGDGGNPYSYEKYGRAIMYSDFVIVGPKTDPAGVATSAPNNPVAAFEAIATAGATGKANFVSRGDASGTNAKEQSIWKLVNQTYGLPIDAAGEPTGSCSGGYACWYHKAGLGQAQTLQEASQCPFSGGGCYAIADRGTFNILVHNKAITNMKIVSQHNPSGPGGPGLMENPYHAYAVNPAAVASKRPNDNLAGALAFLSYLSSRSFQNAVANYPSGQKLKAFHPDAYPVVTPSSTFPIAVKSGTSVTATGNIASALPFSPPLGTSYLTNPPWLAIPAGWWPAPAAPVNLIRKSNGNVVATGQLDANGNYSLTFIARANDTYQIQFPQYVDLQATTKTLGALKVS